MATATARRPRSASSPGPTPRYVRIWTTTALAAAAVWMVVAVMQSPRLLLVCLVVALAAFGGLYSVGAPIRTAAGRRQYLRGAARVAGAVLVVVGIGHHLAAGLLVVALAAVSSPAVVGWLGRR